jgi:hypothetical protein
VSTIKFNDLGDISQIPANEAPMLSLSRLASFQAIRRVIGNGV